MAYDFDGADTFIDIDSSSGFGTLVEQSSHSVAIWVKTDVTNTRQVIIGDWNAGGTGSGIAMEIQTNDTFRYRIFISGVIKSIDSGIILPDTWYFFTGTFNDDSNIMTSYINGEVTGTLNVGAGTLETGTNAVIGKAGARNALFFDGSISDVIIYNYVLSPTQIQQMYNREYNLLAK